MSEATAQRPIPSMVETGLDRDLRNILRKIPGLPAEQQTHEYAPGQHTRPIHSDVHLSEGAQNVLHKMEGYAESSCKHGLHLINNVRHACDEAEQMVLGKQRKLMENFLSYIQALQVLDEAQKGMSQAISEVLMAGNQD